MRSFEHSVQIEASPEAVWATLVDLPGWTAWNVVHPQTQEALRVGGRFPLRIALRPGLVLPAAARLVEVVPARELAWRGGVPGLFTAVHGFSLQPDGGGCRVRHHERFEGALSGAILRLLGPGQAARYAQVNEALKQRVEGTAG